MTNKANMEEEIKKLIELQGLDMEIYRLRNNIELIPLKISEYDTFIKEKESIYKGTEGELTKLHLLRKEKEGDLKSKEETIKKQEGQLYQVKTNQEYGVLEKEIGSLKADNSILEEDILTLMDSADSKAKELEDNKTLYEKEKVKLEAEKKQLVSEKTNFEEDLKKLELQRAEFAQKIDKNILPKYERILVSKDGDALSCIQAHACGGCNMNLPPQVVNEVMLKKNLIVCSNCSRILYTKD